MIPWALATGATEGAQRDVSINTGPYQALAGRVEYHAPAVQFFLIGSEGAPASIADRSSSRGGELRRESHPVILLRKDGDKISMERREAGPALDPWPGVPSLLGD